MWTKLVLSILWAFSQLSLLQPQSILRERLALAARWELRLVHGCIREVHFELVSYHCWKPKGICSHFVSSISYLTHWSGNDSIEWPGMNHVHEIECFENNLRRRSTPTVAPKIPLDTLVGSAGWLSWVWILHSVNNTHYCSCAGEAYHPLTASTSIP